MSGFGRDPYVLVAWSLGSGVRSVAGLDLLQGMNQFGNPRNLPPEESSGGRCDFKPASERGAWREACDIDLGPGETFLSSLVGNAGLLWLELQSVSA